MVVQYLYGDAFCAASGNALMHCVGRDLLMEKGFAHSVTRRFGGQEDLRRQRLDIGDVGVLMTSPRRNRVVLALVTKAKSCAQPTRADFSRTLEKVPRTCMQLGIRALSGPLIGTGLDGLPLAFVQSEVERVFRDSPISVTLWSLPGSLCRSTVLAGDSNFLRVLGVRGELGCVRSGARMEWVIGKLLDAPPAGRVDIMVGTNDVMDATKKGLSGNVARQHARLQLMRIRKAARRLHGPVRFLTIPPLRHIREDATMTPKRFNALLREFMEPFFEVVDVHAALLTVGGTIGKDGVHLNPRGVRIVKGLL